ncbi:MAG: SH3 domain-containing protein [Anaerolinea sp.]|nr:SH3 domain-containing protein [Anaerolinea sp.]
MWRKALIVVLLLSFTAILAVQPAAAQNPTWIAYYFNNTTLEGSPVLTRNENSISYNWGVNAPVSGLNADNFSIRWATDVSLNAGTYRFYALADDNIRIIFNFGLTPVIDTFQSGIVGQLVTADVNVPANGVYHIQVDYRELTNNAFAYVSFANLATNPQGPGFPVPGTGTTPGGTLPASVATAPWTGQYYANGGLLGDPAAILTETSPSHSWGQSAPLPSIPADGFSARWTSVQTLPAGTYTVAARADDGVRVFVNGVLLINQWGAATGQTYTSTLSLPAGAHTFQVEYNEQTLDAYIEFSVYLAGTGGAQPTQAPVLTGAVATVTAFRLNVRDFPSATTGNVITRINRFEQYQITGRNTDATWYQIRLSNGALGWVSGGFISIANGTNIPVVTPGTTTPPTAVPGQTTGIVGIATPYTLNIRSGPGTQFARIARLPAGSSASVVGRNTATQWYQINYNGIVGWVSATYFALPAGTNTSSIPVTG